MRSHSDAARRSPSPRGLRAGAAAFGVAVLGLAGAAVAANAVEHDEGEVEVSVDIAEITEPGVLALSVAAESTTLTEDGSTELERTFTGELPEVTVLDTRSPDQIPEGAAWYVLGTATEFTGLEGQAPIPAENLGWAPRVVGDDADGLVFPGEEEDSLVDTELLFSTIGSGEIPTETAWTAAADLTLRTAPDVEPGSYASTITLSLFE